MNKPHVKSNQSYAFRSNIFCNIGQIITSSLNPDEIFRRTMKVIDDFFSPRNCSLFLREKNTGRLKFEIAMGIDVDMVKDIYIEKGEGVVGWVCEHGKPLVVEDVSKDPRFTPRIDELIGFRTRSIICVPLLNGNNRVVGAIELINKILPDDYPSDADSERLMNDSGAFTEIDMEILAAIGVFTGIAAENAFLHQKVKDMAVSDPLTGVYNRHYFNEMFDKEEKQIKRYNSSICILMMDVDGLKYINDTYGHLAGDRVLKTIADILKSSIRESDILARFGGDEFILMVPHASKIHGEKVAERIETLIKQYNENNTSSEPRLGLSIGVYSAGPDNIDNLLFNADQELYRSKMYSKTSNRSTPQKP